LLLFTRFRGAVFFIDLTFEPLEAAWTRFAFFSFRRTNGVQATEMGAPAAPAHAVPIQMSAVIQIAVRTGTGTSRPARMLA
jgi:hypothetical protein